MIYFEEIAALLVFFGMIGLIYKASAQKAWSGVLFLSILMVVLGYWAFPAKLNYLYKGIWLHIENIVWILATGAGLISASIPVLGGLYSKILYIGEKPETPNNNDWNNWALSITGQQIRRSALLFVLVISLSSLSYVSYDSVRNYLIVREFPVTQISNLIETDPNSIPKHSRETAFTDMIVDAGSNFAPTLNGIDFTISGNTGNGVYAVAPRTPVSNFAKLYNSNGFVAIKDYGEETSVLKINQKVPIGEGQFWMSGIEHSLYKLTWDNRNVLWSTYDRIVPVPLLNEDGKIDRIIYFADQIRVSPFFQIKHWTGTMVIDGSRSEFFTPKEAVNDPRLAGVPLYPHSLIEQTTSAQVADEGYLSQFTPRENKPSFRQNSDGSHIQLMTEEGSHHPYNVVSVQPKNGHGLLHIYLFDAINGDFFRFTPGDDLSLIGYDQAKSRAITESGINPWPENYEIENPVLIFRKNQFYQAGNAVYQEYSPEFKKKLSYTNRFVVINLETSRGYVFLNEQEYDQWLTSGKISEDGTREELIKKLEDLLNQTQQITEQIKTAV